MAVQNRLPILILILIVMSVYGCVSGSGQDESCSQLSPSFTDHGQPCPKEGVVCDMFQCPYVEWLYEFQCSCSNLKWNCYHSFQKCEAPDAGMKCQKATQNPGTCSEIMYQTARELTDAPCNVDGEQCRLRECRPGIFCLECDCIGCKWSCRHHEPLPPDGGWSGSEDF